MVFDFINAEPEKIEIGGPHDPLVKTYSVDPDKRVTFNDNKGDMANARNRNSRLPEITDESAAWALLGVKVEEPVPGEWSYFSCPLPGHDGSAHLEVEGWTHGAEEGPLLLVCNCHGTNLRWSSWRTTYARRLADAYYSIRSGVVLDRKNSEVPSRLAWHLLALPKAGLVVPQRIELPALEATASETEQEARRLFALLCGTRLALADCLGVPPVPMPFASRLLAAWCRISPTQASAAIRELVAHGVIDLAERPGVGRSCYRNQGFRYLPGSSHLDRSLSKRRGTQPCSSRPSSQQ
jgi:hypothetical protein